ncbi:arylamine N-acetyltransferase [Oxalobacteraceae bacterium CAVE-383]|nr:arylamine N-acetyltransferase [Oxalobacteraceae bacterium CAVE-383]
MHPENYFARIGYTGSRAPTHATLAALCAHHIAAIPFENIDVLLERAVDISAPAVEAKLVANRRGGYCFEHNGLFKRVLAALGFDVESLAARVLWLAQENEAPRPRTHSALRVWLDGQAWLVDVGFGGWVPPGPLALANEAPQRIGQEVFRIRPATPARAAGSVILEAELEGVWRALYELSPEPLFDVDYLPLNWFTSTHPGSIFKQDLRAAITTPEARYMLMNGRLTVRGRNGGSERRKLDAAQLETVLRETFGLPVEASWRPLLQRLCGAPEK